MAPETTVKTPLPGDGPDSGQKARWLKSVAPRLRHSHLYGIRLVALAIVLSLLWGGRPFELDLLAQLAPQIGLLLAVIGLILALSHRQTRRTGLELIVAGVLCLTICFGVYQAGRASADPLDREANLRVVTFNGQSGARGVDYDAFSAWLVDQDADLVCVVEAPWSFLGSDEWLGELYPYRVRPDATWRWPVVLLSKRPFESVKLAPTDEVVRHSFVRIRSMLVQFDEERELLFTAMHQPSPRTRASWSRGKREAARDSELLRNFSEKAGIPVIVAGDFNATPTGVAFQEFAMRTDLRGCASMFGRQGSWPSSLPERIALPIDQVWISAEIYVRNAASGPDFGSDHRPVVADLILPR